MVWSFVHHFLFYFVKQVVRFVKFPVGLINKICDILTYTSALFTSSKECDKVALFFADINSIHPVSPPVDSLTYQALVHAHAACLTLLIDVVNSMTISTGPVDILPTHYLKEAVSACHY